MQKNRVKTLQRHRHYYHYYYYYKQAYVHTLYLHVRRIDLDLVDARIVSPEHALLKRSDQTIGDDTFESYVTEIQRICNHNHNTAQLHYVIIILALLDS